MLSFECLILHGVLIFSIVVVICVFGRGKITKTYCSRRDQIL